MWVKNRKNSKMRKEQRGERPTRTGNLSNGCWVGAPDITIVTLENPVKSNSVLNKKS